MLRVDVGDPHDGQDPDSRAVGARPAPQLEHVSDWATSSASSRAARVVAGEVTVAGDAVMVHCAAPGLKYPPLVPVWAPDAITLQPIRAGFPCFGAAFTGYVEATRADDAEKNRVCPPSPLPDTLPVGRGCR